MVDMPFLSSLAQLCVLSCFSQVWLCDTTDHSPSGSSVHGILQARILECVAMPSSRVSSWPRDRTCVSCGSCTAGRFFTTWATGERGSTWHLVPLLRGGWSEVSQHMVLLSGNHHFLIQLMFACWQGVSQFIPGRWHIDRRGLENSTCDIFQISYPIPGCPNLPACFQGSVTSAHADHHQE